SILTPGNFPSARIICKLGAALAAGCMTIIKPLPETGMGSIRMGLHALAIAELQSQLTHFACVPDGVIKMVTTEKNATAVGKEICESLIVKKVTFIRLRSVTKLFIAMATSTLQNLVSFSYSPQSGNRHLHMIGSVVFRQGIS
ncbi:hypothetical protein GYMLUDRAFT_163371, partial [Collybiopsis luxurians FD-317 M1]